jgi:hypothetical protein
MMDQRVGQPMPQHISLSNEKMYFNASWKKRASGVLGWKLCALVIWPPLEPILLFGVP